MRAMSPHEESYAEKGVVMLAVNAHEDPEQGKAFIASTDLELNWTFADAQALEALGVGMVPTQILLDREGKIAWTSSFTSLMGGADAILEQVDALL